MASIAHDGGGFRRLLFVLDDKRHKIHLGKMAAKAADKVKSNVEQIIECRRSGRALYDETADWLRTIDDTMHDKLASKGIVAPRPKMQHSTLGAWLDHYIAERCDVKESTATVYGHTKRCLIKFFGANKPLRDINAGDADAFRRWLTSHEKLAVNTANRRCGIAKQFFRAALRHRAIAENPFADLKGVGVVANKERFYFVSRAEADKVLAACPDAQWKLLFALSRFGGLRCPSEHLGLTWGDVNFETSRILVRSPKTEHIAGKAERLIPLFPELREPLEAVFNEFESEHGRPPASSDPVIWRYRDTNANLRTTLKKILARAGVKPWPKLFQNLRSTRQTELAEQFPSHVVCDWIGNSQAIAQRHYLQTTADHFDAAVSARAREAETTARETAQSAAASPCVDSQEQEELSGMTHCVGEKWAALDSNQ